jgi:hypothetical protein
MSSKGGGGSQVVGYRYYMAVLMGLCRGPVDEVTEIKVSDRTAWTGTVTGNTNVEISADNLFGGDDKEGGVRGPLFVAMGASDQVLADGQASATLTFGAQPDLGDTVTINGIVYTFVEPLPPVEDGGVSSEGGAGSGEGGGEADG